MYTATIQVSMSAVFKALAVRRCKSGREPASDSRRPLEYAPCAAVDRPALPNQPVWYFRYTPEKNDAIIRGPLSIGVHKGRQRRPGLRHDQQRRGHGR